MRHKAKKKEKTNKAREVNNVYEHIFNNFKLRTKNEIDKINKY